METANPKRRLRNCGTRPFDIKKKTRPEGLRDGFASDRVEKLKTTLHDSSAIGLRQIFVDDPNGLKLELNFWRDR